MEESASEKPCVAKKGSAVRKAAPEPPVQKVLPKRQARSKKSTAQPQPSSSEDEAAPAPQAAATRTRMSRRNVTKAKAAADSEMEPDKMRTMEEDVVEALDMTFEQLRMSDTETEDNALKENTGVYFEHNSTSLWDLGTAKTAKLLIISSQQ